MTATINIDEDLIKKAEEYYPGRTIEDLAQTAIKRYLAAQGLLRLKGILTEDDLWPEYRIGGEKRGSPGVCG